MKIDYLFQISVLHDMWVGESAKFVTAIFTLADKLSKYSPVIVFIDEIDTLLRWVQLLIQFHAYLTFSCFIRTPIH